jgi:putative ABC transport system permease protein
MQARIASTLGVPQTHTKEQTLARFVWASMIFLLADIRHATRSLRRSPLVAVVAMACVGLGIAVATTTFSIADGIMFRSLPFPDADRMVHLGVMQAGGDTSPDLELSYPDFRDWRDQASVFETMAGASLRTVTVSDGREATMARGALVTWDMLPMTGVQPAIGRGFTAADDAPGAEPVVLLSDELWRQRFNADPSVVGRALTIDGRPHTVVGVMPRRFAFPFTQQLWMPLESGLRAPTRGERAIFVFARLRPGATLPQAAAQVDGIATRLAAQYRENAGWTSRVQLVRQLYNPAPVVFTLWLMLAAGVCVLLIACANLANLTLARAITRQGELALRFAMGASRAQVIRLVLVDAVVLAAIGLPLGLALAKLGLVLFDRALVASASNVPYTLTWALDARVVLFAVLATVASGVVSGLGAALRASRSQPREMLTSGSPGAGAGGRRHWLRDALVVAEVAVSLVLLSGAGLFFRSFLKSYADSGGIDVERMVTMRLWLPDATYPDPDAVARRFDDIVARVQALPGVTNVTASSLIPLDGGTRGATILPERGPSAPGEELRLRYAAVTADFFPTIGVPVQRGRDFEAFEGTTRSGVAVVNAAMAARLWPSEDPLGRTFRFADAAGSEPFRVIGVAPNFNNEGVVDERAPVPTAYIPFAYDPARDAGLMVRTAGDPAAMTPAIREAIRALDANLPLNEVRSMAQLQRDENWAFNFTAWTFGLLGGVALILGGMGAFGVLAYAVSQRTYEIGVRMALGARGVDIVAMFMRHGAWLCGLGVLVGLGLTLAVAPLLQIALYQTSARDPITFATISAFLVATGLLASYLPARRASRLDPTRTLR